MIDRISPTRRPPGVPVGYQSWRALLFLHWPVPAHVLRPLVPEKLSVDLHGGMAYVGLTPFLMKRVRPALVPSRLGLEFPETNVRTYVHVNGQDPGVYFFSLDAASLLAVAGARASLGLPYFHARARVRRQDSSVDYELQRLSGRRPRLAVRYTPGVYLGASQPGTLEHFLLERYLLHVDRRGTLWTVQVHHQPYPVQQAHVLEIHDQLMAADGLLAQREPPPVVHFASGVDVEVFGPKIRMARRAW